VNDYLQFKKHLLWTWLIWAECDTVSNSVRKNRLCIRSSLCGNQNKFIFLLFWIFCSNCDVICFLLMCLFHAIAPLHWMIGAWGIKTAWCFHLQGLICPFLWTFWSPCCLKMSSTHHPVTCHISEEQRLRLHHSRNPKIYVQVIISYKLDAVLMSHNLTLEMLN